MTRIIAGLAKGKQLTVPPGGGTRPTSDRAREGLFNSLHTLRGPLEGARLLDLYAGSGAIGLEALSRGADRAAFVESDAKALRALRANIAALGLPGEAVVLPGKVSARLAGEDAQPYDVVFLDPPYVVTAAALDGVLTALVTSGWLAPAALLVVERASHDIPLALPAPYEAVQERRYGEATLWYGRAPG